MLHICTNVQEPVLSLRQINDEDLDELEYVYILDLYKYSFVFMLDMNIYKRPFCSEDMTAT